MTNFLAVFLGGGLGALTRYLIYLATPKNCYMPYSTMIANFLGCFLASLIFTYFVSKNDTDSINQIFLITGFCGGLSTLSALSLEVLEFIQSGDYIRAFVYILTSLLICTISVILGISVVKKYV